MRLLLQGEGHDRGHARGRLSRERQGQGSSMAEEELSNELEIKSETLGSGKQEKKEGKFSGEQSGGLQLALDMRPMTNMQQY